MSVTTGTSPQAMASIRAYPLPSAMAAADEEIRDAVVVGDLVVRHAADIDTRSRKTADDSTRSVDPIAQHLFAEHKGSTRVVKTRQGRLEAVEDRQRIFVCRQSSDPEDQRRTSRPVAALARSRGTCRMRVPASTISITRAGSPARPLRAMPAPVRSP